LAVPAAQREVDRMAGVCVDMIVRIGEALTADSATRTRLTELIRADELTTDVLEHKINEYLAALVSTQLSTPMSKETLSLMSMINDLERIGDHGEKIALLLDKVSESGLEFTTDAAEELQHMARTTDENLRAMRSLILRRQRDPMPAATERENQLNELRDRYRQSHLQRMVEGRCDALSGVIFSDLLTSFEKMGDHSYNVIEATAGIK
jgi:phosphate:Na+ symporter